MAVCVLCVPARASRSIFAHLHKGPRMAGADDEIRLSRDFSRWVQSGRPGAEEGMARAGLLVRLAVMEVTCCLGGIRANGRC